MRRLAPVLLFVLLLGTSLACQAATSLLYDDTPTPISVPTSRPTSTPLPPTPTPNTCPGGNCILSCVNKLGAIVQPQARTPRHEFASDQEYTLVTYNIDGNQIDHPVLGKVPNSIKSYQNDKSTQTELWDYFAALIPMDQRTFLSHYIVVTDGKDNVLAYMSQSESSPKKWDFSIDIMDTSDPKDLTFTMIHEFGHLLTLNPNQVPPSQAIFDHPNSDSVFNKEEDACPNYFPGEGCSRKNSYINLFYQRFWTKIYDEWLVIDNIEDQDTFDARLEKFYNKYRSQFVTDYAPTSPEEDIAESWAYFILKPKPADRTIANKKVLFFYDFPELVKLREQIARNLCNQLEK